MGSADFVDQCRHLGVRFDGVGENGDEPEPVVRHTAIFDVEIEAGQAAEVEERSQDLDPNRALPPGGDNIVCIDGATTCYDEAYRAPGERVAVIDGQPRSSLVTWPADGRIPALTDAARAMIAEYNDSRAQFAQYDHPELRPLAERCLVSFGSSAGPPMLPNYWYNNNYTIVQNEEYVMIMAEMVHDVRIIRLGERRGDVAKQAILEWVELPGDSTEPAVEPAAADTKAAEPEAAEEVAKEEKPEESPNKA